jgi:hypothetical protein
MSKEIDSAERQTALDLALERNHRRLILPKVVADLREAGISVSPSDFLSLEGAKAIEQSFYARFRGPDPVRREVWPAQEFPEVVHVLQELAAHVGPIPVVLFRLKEDLLTAVAVPADAVLMHVPASTRLGEEDLALTTPDLQHGLRLELNWYDDTGQYVPESVYELRRWGLFAQ